MRPDGRRDAGQENERATATRRCPTGAVSWLARTLLAGCLLLPPVLLAQLPAPTNDVVAAARSEPRSAPSVSLLTVGPGALYFERFGHNAIVLRDPSGGSAAAYNYGMFDFGEDDFLLNFVRGRMRYRIVADALDEDLAVYRAEGRSVIEQRLDLSAAQSGALATFLEWNARPENALYRYDYFLSNCSTRVRDALDRALGGILKAQSEGRSRGYTWRIDALRLMAPQPALMLLIDLGLGPFADQRIDFWEESFVPMTLADVVAGARLADGRPLVAATAALAPNRVTEPPPLPPDLRWPFLLLGLGLGGALVWLGRRRGAVARMPLALFGGAFELACGIGGLLLLFLWFGTEHQAAWRNENLALLNPLCLLLVPATFGLRRAGWRADAFARGLAWLVVLIAALALFSKILPWFPQANAHWIFLLLPIHLALALNLLRRSTAPAESTAAPATRPR